jgi:hypothetical protein
VALFWLLLGDVTFRQANFVLADRLYHGVLARDPKNAGALFGLSALARSDFPRNSATAARGSCRMGKGVSLDGEDSFLRDTPGTTRPVQAGLRPFSPSSDQKVRDLNPDAGSTLTAQWTI